MGLTVSGLVRIAVTKVANEKPLPFEMTVSDALTAKTPEKSGRDEDICNVKNADD